MNTSSDRSNRSLLAVFAHPDDESIMMGGTLALYARRGYKVDLLCATRGEFGSVSDASLLLADHADLGFVRENELRRACEILGINLLGFLDCPDSGVNESDWVGVEEKIVRQIRCSRPQIVVTFGPDGWYWHPDHVAISYLTAAAFASAADPERFTEQLEDNLEPFAAAKLYYASYPDFLMRQMIASAQAKSETAHLWNLSPDLFGVPVDQITAIINVEETLTAKMKAIRAHQTQLAPDNIFSEIDEADAQRFLSKEYFSLAQPQQMRSPKIEFDLFG